MAVYVDLRQLTQQLVSLAFAVAWPLFLQLTQHLPYRVCVADMLAFILLFEQLVWPCLWLASLPIFLLFVWLTPKCSELCLPLAFSEVFFLFDSENNWLSFLMRPWDLKKNDFIHSKNRLYCLLVHVFAAIACIVLVNLQFGKLERLIYGLYSPGMRMRSRIFRVYVHRAMLGI